MTAFRYWRILVSAVNDSWPSVQISEVEWRTVIGGAKSAPVVITADNSVSGFDAAFVDDGDFSTAWATDGGAGLPRAIVFDFGVDISFTELAIAPRATAEIYAPRAFTIDGSPDGVVWTNVNTISGQSGYVADTFKTFQVVSPPALKIAKANLAIASHPTARVMISKANLAVASLPTARIVISKTNLAISSHPKGRILISKTNIAFASGIIIVPPPAPRRRQIFVHAVCGQLSSYNINSVSLNGSPILVDGNTVEF